MGNTTEGAAGSPGAPSKELAKYKWTEIQKHKAKGDIWIVVSKKVYNVSPFLDEHPGGPDILLEQGGRDATQHHTEINHSQDAIAMMQDFLIGHLDETP